MGKVIHGEYDISTADWYKRYERHLYADTSYTTMAKRVYPFIHLGVEPSPDYFMLLKPFTKYAWTLTVASNIFLALSAYSFRKNSSSNSFKIFEISSLLLFVLVHAFFSGALTMVQYIYIF